MIVFLYLGPWQPCPVSCIKKMTQKPMRHRTIICVDQNDVSLPDRRCEDKIRPNDYEPCNSVLPECIFDDLRYTENEIDNNF